ncbi:MAG TPA: lactonase family protein [Pyrinomonadaceae bacterium]|nr:lactonase family protein [Pyrinomonadaceae bacterium]
MGVTGLGLLGLNLHGSLYAQARRVSRARELNLYVGTYTTGKKSEGIYLYRLNMISGALSYVRTAKGVVDPSFLAVDRSRRFLYAVNEVTEFGGKPGGAVSAFSIEQGDGNLTFLNQQPSLGGAPCHLILDQTGRFLLVANYVGGNVSVLPIERDGRLGAPTELVQHQGHSVKPEQEGPHAHCVTQDHAGRYVLVTDLGLDKIMVYKFDAKKGKLRPNAEPSATLKTGAGPRHLSFHPGGKFAYVINELDSTITAFAYRQATGTLGEVQIVSTLPKDFSGKNSCAEIAVAPDGKFLYGSNRGHDSIVVFAIDEQTGRLAYVEHQPTQGKTPRHFTIDPTGAFLLAANQNSDTIVVFRINHGNGKLAATGKPTEVPSPVCLVLV